MTGLCPSFPSPSLASNDFGGETIFPVHSWSNFSPSDGNLCHAPPNPTTTPPKKRAQKTKMMRWIIKKNPSKIGTLFGMIHKRKPWFFGVISNLCRCKLGGSGVIPRREAWGNVRRPVPIEVAARFKAVDSGVPDRFFAGIFCRRDKKTKNDKQTKHTTPQLKHNKMTVKWFVLQDLIFSDHFKIVSPWYIVCYIWYKSFVVVTSLNTPPHGISIQSDHPIDHPVIPSSHNPALTCLGIWQLFLLSLVWIHGCLHHWKWWYITRLIRTKPYTGYKNMDGWYHPSAF